MSAECEIFGEVHTVKQGVRARLTWREPEWSKPTIAQVHVVPRSSEKCIVSIQHLQLPDGRQRVQLRAHWKAMLLALLTAMQNRN